MKKVLFIAILSCYLLSMAIVPMNVGNKWYYYCEFISFSTLPLDTLKFYKIAKVEKDTLIGQIPEKKIVKIYSIPTDSDFIAMFPDEVEPEMWYEQNQSFYRHSRALFTNGALDSTWNGGNGQRITYQSNYFTTIYTIQELSDSYHGNWHTSWDYKTANNLGVIYMYSYLGGTIPVPHHLKLEVLVAAIIDGVYLGDSLATTTTGIYEQTADIKTPILISNYPNPFNPTTDISFNLAQTQTAKLAVYNNRGELVRVLADQKFSVGRHSIPFNGAGLNSGVYFYQLELAGVKSTGKMIMLK